MGQRFQAHYILKNSKGETYTRAFHLQWCWGYYAVIRLHQVLDYFKDQLRCAYCPFNGKKSWNEEEEIMTTLCGLTSLNLVSKSYVNAIYEESINEDPLLGDNNDGIFIVDLRGEEPKYCFIRDINCIEDNLYCKPITAREYFNLYHGIDPKKWDEEEREDIKIACKFLDDIDNFKLLTIDEIREAYPKMSERLNKEATASIEISSCEKFLKEHGYSNDKIAKLYGFNWYVLDKLDVITKEVKKVKDKELKEAE